MCVVVREKFCQQIHTPIAIRALNRNLVEILIGLRDSPTSPKHDRTYLHIMMIPDTMYQPDLIWFLFVRQIRVRLRVHGIKWSLSHHGKNTICHRRTTEKTLNNSLVLAPNRSHLPHDYTSADNEAGICTGWPSGHW